MAIAASAQEATPAGEKFTYIVVLHDRPPKDGSAEPTEPDLPAIGGEVLHQWRNRRVVRMSEQAVRALAVHRGVKYIQRVQMDGALPELPRSETIAAAAVVGTDWAPPSWSSGEYVYDGDGNITAIGTAASPASDNGTEAYVYDSAGRLVSATLTHGSTDSEEYSYDAFGNLIDTVRTAGPSTATPVDAATNRLAGMTYDGVGNLTKNESGTAEYYYDGFNMLRLKVTGGTIAAWYLYTADDERIGAEENGEIRWMIRDLNGRVLREWEASGWSDLSWWLWREDYMHRGSGLAAAEREPAEGGTRHFHLDHLGTPRLITDANGMKFALHDYFPFGVERSDFRQEMQERGTDRPEPMKFTGHERDFTAGTATNNRNQLDYMHARYYSPVWGRFLSVDPVLDLERTLRQPQRWNRYTYVINNPINKIDPDGRMDPFEQAELCHVCRPPLTPSEQRQADKITLGLAALPFAVAAAPEIAFEGSLLLMRNPGTVLAGMKLLDAMGGDSSSHINTTGLTGGKHGYLLDNATKTGFFRGVMGLTERTIGGVLRAHFAENFAKSSKFNEKGLLEVTGRMVDAKGRAWNVTTAWQWVEKTKTWAFVTADNFQKVK